MKCKISNRYMDFRGMMCFLPVPLLRKYKGVFITGTDTGVGKTMISCLIAKELRKRGISVGIMKPVCTGSRKDAFLLRKSAGTDDTIDDINPIFLKKPLAPLVAARLEKKRIYLEKILSAYKKLCRRYNFMIVEGTGGLLVPVTKDIFMADIAGLLGLPVIIVSRAGLGAINHTLLTINCARHYRLKILGFILNNTKKCRQGLAEKTNPGAISKLGRVKYLGTVRYYGNR